MFDGEGSPGLASSLQPERLHRVSWWLWSPPAHAKFYNSKMWNIFLWRYYKKCRSCQNNWFKGWHEDKYFITLVMAWGWLFCYFSGHGMRMNIWSFIIFQNKWFKGWHEDEYFIFTYLRKVCPAQQEGSLSSMVVQKKKILKSQKTYLTNILSFLFCFLRSMF